MSKHDSRPALTAARLREMFDYDPDTGLFTRRVFAGGEKPGTIAGRVKPNGYRTISLDYRQNYAHRLAWLYVHGVLPTKAIDHINRVRDDNRIANLREASASLNNINFGYECKSNNKLGFLGVYFYKGKFVAQIGRGPGVSPYIGRFDTAEEANAAYLQERTKRDAEWLEKES